MRKEGEIMQVDRYAKLVLTAIALCLLWLCLRAEPRAVEAEYTVQDVNIVQVGGVKVPKDRPMFKPIPYVPVGPSSMINP